MHRHTYGFVIFTLAVAACGGDKKPAKAETGSEDMGSPYQAPATETATAAEPVATTEPSAAPAASASADPEPDIVPGYPMENVVKTLKTAKEKFLICAELEKFPSPGALRFDIDEKGNVVDAAFRRGEDAVKPDARQSCILVHLRQLKFPPPPKGKLTVTYPLVEEAL
jgi:hypothetical protein